MKKIEVLDTLIPFINAETIIWDVNASNLNDSFQKLIFVIEDSNLPCKHAIRVLSYAAMKRKRSLNAYFDLFNTIIDKYKPNYIDKMLNQEFLELFNNYTDIRLHKTANLEDSRIKNAIVWDEVENLQEIVAMDGFDWADYNIHLDAAAQWGSPNCFRFLLLNKNENDINIDYLKAIAGGNKEIIKFVFENRQKSKKELKNAYKVAVEYHHNDVADWLLEHYYSLAFKDVTSYQCLFYFCNTEASWFLHHVKRFSSKSEGIKRLPGEQFINYAAMMDSLDLMKEFIELLDIKESIYHEDIEEEVVNQKHLTRFGNYVEEKMISYVEENVENSEINEMKPIIFALYYKNHEMLEYLLKMKSTLNTTFVSPIDGSVYSPLSFAIQNYQNDDAKILIENGASLFYRHRMKRKNKTYYSGCENDHFYDILSLAAKNGMKDICMLCLEKNAPIFKNTSHSLTRNEPNNTPTALMYACMTGLLDVVKILYERGVDTNQQIEKHKNIFVTALKYACKTGNLEIVQFLVDKGASINETYSKSQKLSFCSPLSLAIQSQNLSLVKFLLEKGANTNIILRNKNS